MCFSNFEQNNIFLDSSLIESKAVIFYKNSKINKIAKLKRKKKIYKKKSDADNEGFEKNLYDFLINEVEKKKQHKDTKWLYEACHKQKRQSLHD